jgi:hypothetical protein
VKAKWAGRLIYRGLVLSLLVGILAGCGADNASPAPAQTPVQSPTAVISSTLRPTVTAVVAATVSSPGPLVAPARASLTNSVTLAPPVAPWSAATANPAWPDLTAHEGAMISTFKADVGIARGLAAPIYNIAAEVRVTGDLPQAAGREQLFYTNATGQSQDSLYLWLYPNAAVGPGDEPPLGFANVQVNGQPAAVALENNRASLRVFFGRPLAPNGQAVIELDFALKLNAIKVGQDYARWSADDQVLLLNYWYPQLAIYDPAIGGWDVHPYSTEGDVTTSRVSFFNLWLTAPADMVVAPNGRVVSSTLGTDGTKRTTRVVTGPVRDCVAVFSSRYQEVSQMVGETKVTAYVLDKDKSYAGKMVQYSADALRTFNEAFGTYPYAEYRVVEAPLSFWGGLEFPGLVYLTTRYFSSDMTQPFEFALVHETGHQWFYGLVGNDQYRHAWLDESLTQFVGLLYYEKFRTPAQAQIILNNYMTLGYQAAVAAGEDGPVDQVVDQFKPGDYVVLVYNKGGLFFDAYRRQFGQAAFLKFARNYFQSNRYKMVWPDDVLKALKAGVEPSQVQAVQDLYRKWIEGKG